MLRRKKSESSHRYKGTGNFLVGTKVRVKCTNHDGDGKLGELLEITNTHGSSQNPSPTYYYHAKSLDDGSEELKVYHGELELAELNREERIAETKVVIKELQETLKKRKVELEHLEKYEDEEDFLAHKIADIMKAGGDAKAIREILKQKAPTHLL